MGWASASVLPSGPGLRHRAKGRNRPARSARPATSAACQAYHNQDRHGAHPQAGECHCGLPLARVEGVGAVIVLLIMVGVEGSASSDRPSTDASDARLSHNLMSSANPAQRVRTSRRKKLSIPLSAAGIAHGAIGCRALPRRGFTVSCIHGADRDRRNAAGRQHFAVSTPDAAFCSQCA